MKHMVRGRLAEDSDTGQIYDDAGQIECVEGSLTWTH